MSRLLKSLRASGLGALSVCLLVAAVAAGCSQEKYQSSNRAVEPAADYGPAPEGMNAADWTFFQQIARDLHSEVEMAKLAANQASLPAAKEYAKRVQADAEDALSRLGTFAELKKVEVPTELSPAAQATKRQLGQLSDKAFDRAYIESEIAAHESMIKRFENYIEVGKESRLHDHATITLIGARDHLQRARKIKEESFD